MTAAVWTVGLLAAAVLWLQLVHVFGRPRGLLLGLFLVTTLSGGWWLLGRSGSTDAPPADWSAVASVPADACARCHADHYASWYRTYHRTMTREATPENVKGDFNNAVYDYQGLRTRLTREGEAYFMETVDPGWAFLRARAGDSGIPLPPPRMTKFRVDRLVGSHWIQECMHRSPNGRYSR